MYKHHFGLYMKSKPTRSALFRTRLRDALRRAAISQAKLADLIDSDRSTISQILSEQSTRVPSAHLVAQIAEAIGISSDWLLGLTDRPERPTELVAAHMSVTQALRSAYDEQVAQWLDESVGYKVRHVPATLPDMLKTEAMQRWEYQDSFTKTPDQAVKATEDLVSWISSNGSDYEIALPVHELTSFAFGQGYYANLPREIRLEQLAHIRTVHDQLFPRLRITLFDAQTVYSAPITVYGPRIAVLYVGRYHFAFREKERINRLIEHFDWLVREAVVDSRELDGYITELIAQVE